MVRFNDKKQATELSPDDILIMTDISDSRNDKKVTMEQMADYVAGIVPSNLPEQSGHSGQYLTTDGTNPSWADVSSLPSITGNEKKYLYNDGTDVVWRDTYHPNIFEVKWSDHILNDIQWLRGDTFSWQSGSVYVTAYNTLLDEYNATTGTSTDTIGNYTVTYKRTANGYKIADADQETTIKNIYDSTGVAWYYILDSTNTRFKLPRTKWGMVGLRDTVGTSTDIATTGTNVKATQMYQYFYVGEYAREAVEQTAGLNAELFNEKASIDLDNLSSVGQAKLGQDNRLYEGVNLETKFATEIATYGNVYAWLEARKNDGNYNDIYIGDYFYVTMSAGTVAGYTIAKQTFKCRIIGLDTYKNCGDTAIGHMIYVMSDEVIDTPIKWNPVDTNNGTSVQANPWLASALYAVLNGVNNYTTSAYGSKAHGANGGTGIIGLLPSTLQSVLKQKRDILDSRYSSSGELSGGTNWAWGDKGKLWVPNEIEVYGTQIRSNLSQTSGYWNPEAGLSIQFPWFANNCEHRIKLNSSGTHCGWWLSSAGSSYATIACYVDGSGYANGYSTSHSIVCSPLGFCI